LKRKISMSDIKEQVLVNVYGRNVPGRRKVWRRRSFACGHSKGNRRSPCSVERAINDARTGTEGRAMTQDDLTNTLTAIASLAADAARIAGALDELMKAEQTAWRRRLVAEQSARAGGLVTRGAFV
jgi:hypothetical protein